MLKKIFFILICFGSLTASGQIRFGYLSYQKVISMMPEYQNAIQELNTLKSKCNEEAKRSEDELVKKYAEFLQGQKEFPENILQKRQNELQSLINNGLMFRRETELLLKNAEKEMQSEAENKLNQALEAVGQEQGLAFILNTDNNACPFINKSSGIDITHNVLVKLGLVKSQPIAVPESTTTIQKNGVAKGTPETGTAIQPKDSVLSENDFLKGVDSSLINTIHTTDTIADNE